MSTKTEEIPAATLHSIRMDRQEALTKIGENAARHEIAYAQAYKDWRKAVKKALKAALKTFEDGDDDLSAITRVAHVFPQPPDNRGAYSNAISLLEMQREDDINLTRVEFEQYILDQWAWKEVFNSSVAGYSGAKG